VKEDQVPGTRDGRWYFTAVYLPEKSGKIRTGGGPLR